MFSSNSIASGSSSRLSPSGARSTVPPCTCSHLATTSSNQSTNPFSQLVMDDSFSTEEGGRAFTRTGTALPAYCSREPDPPMWTPPSSANSSTVDLTSSNNVTSRKSDSHQHARARGNGRSLDQCWHSTSSAHSINSLSTTQTNPGSTMSSSSSHSRFKKFGVKRILSAFDAKAEQARREERKRIQALNGGGNRVGNIMWDMSNGW
ncbi:hypothetical protein ACM66B_003392 [Microbotryomycetes sp. NB124-2]